MNEQNEDNLPAAAGSHQPCKGGVAILLAVMAAICVGMWWIAPPSVALGEPPHHQEYYGHPEIVRAGRIWIGKNRTIMIKGWTVDCWLGGPFHAIPELTFCEPGYLISLNGDGLSLEGLSVDETQASLNFTDKIGGTAPIKEKKMDSPMYVNHLRIETVGTNPTGLIHINHEMPFAMHGVSDSGVEKFGEKMEDLLKRNKQ